MKRKIERADIIDIAAYGKNRREHRRRVTELKRNRRIEVGPFATFYFENYDTMWHQVHEMLHIERGGEAQIADELDAYNPLIPQGDELIATVMFEIDDPQRRDTVLATLGGIENRTYLSVAGARIMGEPDPTRENTSSEGKASAVQFIRYKFTPAQIVKFRDPGTQVLVGVDHPRYGHIAVMPDAVRAALAEDFGA
ncbi:MAG TPA: DUF3501 family protein [Stellaceae bacterium]|nr:DUF3501 family protein [Stellaceae bacterium]